jgi:hypothetical protein
MKRSDKMEKLKEKKVKKMKNEEERNRKGDEEEETKKKWTEKKINQTLLQLCVSRPCLS